MPKVNEALSTLQATFKLRKANTPFYLVVGVMVDASDVTSFVPIDTVSPTGVGTWEDFTVSFASYSGTGARIAFLSSGSTNDMYLDNLIVDVPQTCFPPETVVAQNITTSSAVVVWNNLANSIGYDLEYKAQDEEQWQTISNLTDTTYMLSGLTDNTVYQVRVRTNCTDGHSSYWTEELSFRTNCAGITSLPYVENFDSYGTGSAAFPDCMTKYNSSVSSSFPYIHTTHFSAPGSLYFEQTADYHNLAALPEVDASIVLQNLQISFKAYKTSATDKILVGIMEDNNDDSTFVVIDTISPETTNSWQTFDISLSQYTGLGRYIAFMTDFGAANHIYIDDVLLDYIPTCKRPYGLAVSDQGNGLLATWSSDNGSCSFLVQYKSAYAEDWQEMTATDTFALIAPVSGQTIYQVRVAALCDGGSTQSQFSDIQTATTACGPIHDFPYQENFDTYGSCYGCAPTCWTKKINGMGQVQAFPRIVAETYVSAPYCIELFASPMYNSFVILSSPEIDDYVAMNQLHVSFWAAGLAGAYSLKVGVISNPNDPSTFEEIQNIVPSASGTTWEHFDVSLASYTGTGHYIAFRSAQGAALQTGIAIDNVVIDRIQSCSTPTDLTVSHYVQNGVTVSWTPGASETAWNLAYKAADENTWTNVTNLTDPFYVLTGLDASTTYQVKVQSACDSSEVSAYTSSVTFTTLCPPITAIPYTENFESYLAGASYFPDCWTKITYQYPTYPFPISTISIGSTAYNSNRSLSFSSPEHTYCYAVLPELDASLEMDSLMLTGWIRKNGGSLYLEVGIMTDPSDPNTFQFVKKITPSATNAFEQFTVYFLGHSDAGRFIAFRSNVGFYTSAMLLDNVVLTTAPPCFEPQQVTVSNITSSSAEVSWLAPSGSTSWELAYGVAGFVVDTVTPLTLGIDHYALSNLEANTTYDVYVRAACGNASTAWVQTSFRTMCTPVAIPYTEDFDQDGTGTAAFPACWTRISNVSTPYIASTDAATGFTLPGALYFNTTSANGYQYAVLPEMSVDLSNLQVSMAFKAAMNNINHIDVGVMTDVNDPATFTLVGTVEPQTAVWNGFTVPLTSYAGSGKYIAFRVLGATTCYLDQVTVDYASGCLTPFNIVTNDLTTTSATVSWTPGHGESEWLVSIGAPGYSPTSGGVTYTTTQPTYAFTGLDPATGYDVYVKAVCSASESSAWSNSLTFQTACLKIDSLPYTENFNSYGTGSMAFPTCWSRNSSYISSTQYPYINTNSDYYDGPSLYFYSTSSTYTIATTPEFDTSINLNTLRVNFKMRCSSVTSKLKVGVMSDPQDFSTFVLIQECNPPYNNWTSLCSHSVDLSSYTGDARYIAFVTSGAPSQVRLDDVEIDLIPACEAPTNLTITNVTDNSVSLSWTENGDANSWFVEYGNPGFTPGTGSVVTATTNPFTVLNLDPTVHYDFYVKANCGDTTSVYSNVVSAVVASYNMTVSGSDTITTCSKVIFDNGGLDGNYNNNCNSILVIYPAVSGNVISVSGSVNTWNELDYLQVYDGVGTSNILGGYSGDMTVPLITSSTGPLTLLFHSDYGSNAPGFEITVSCTGDVCYPPTGLAVGDIYPTSATASWTPGGAETSWNVMYKEASESTWQNATTNTTNITMDNLTPNTDYQVRVQGVCGADDISAWTEPVTFTTSVMPDCPAPTNLNYSVDHTDVTLTWQQEPNTANEWQVKYRQLTESTWNTATATTTTYTLTGLEANRLYMAQVVAVCDYDQTSNASNSVTFETNNIGIEDHLSKSVNLYPNPATEMISVEVTDANIMITGVEVYNVYGQLINTIVSTENPLRINVSGLADGMYYVRVTTDNGVVTKNFVKR